VENCINAGAISAEEERVRQILADRMAEVQVNPARPDESRQFKIDSGYGPVILNQKTLEAHLEEEEGGELPGMYLVTLSAEWQRGRRGSTTVHHVERSENVTSQWIRSNESGSGVQAMKLEFYVFRP
jgi:hypothetical protein